MKVLEEPLLHFLLIAALLFGAYAWLNRGAVDVDPARQVRVSQGDVHWLRETWRRQWQREPTREELGGLVTTLVKEELLAREARVLRLDENDTIVRRRLAQKMEFLVQDTARIAEPNEEELKKFQAAHGEWFQTDPRISFEQVYFSRERRRDAAVDAKVALVALARGEANAAAMGDRLLDETELRDADPQAVAGRFGRDFANRVFALPRGVWSGPLESGYGFHLVRVSALKPGRQREFADVKVQVLERWREQHQRKESEKYFAGLLKKYNVVVDDGMKPLVGPLAAQKATRP